MKFWLAVASAVASLLVVAWWKFTVANEWVLYRWDLVPVFMVVTFIFGPAVQEGRPVVSYALPCLMANLAGFTTNCLCFLVYITPGC